MAVREGPPQPAPPPADEAPKRYPPEPTRGSQTILWTPARRAIFIGGLVALVALVVLLRLWP